MYLRAILLDMDGTIADSLPVLYEVYCSFLEGYGVEGTREEFQLLNGPSLREAIEHLKLKYAIHEEVSSLYEKYCQLFQDSYSTCLKPFPGTREFLSFVEENGVPLALVTSAPRDLTEVFLESQDLRKYFRYIVAGEDVSETKPSPQPYEKALDFLGVAPRDALVVEDSINGIQAGISAGVPTIMITHRPSYEGIPQGILATVDSWDQLRRLIEPRVVNASAPAH